MPQGRGVAAEPPFSAVLRNVFARARKRPLVAAALAAGATAAVVALRVAAPPSYVAALTFRMDEGHVIDPRNLPPPPPRVREYVSSVALSRTRLLELMERHGISPQLRANDPLAAVDALRADIGVDVVRNYFLLDRRPGEPRSALVVVSFTSTRREQALAIVHDIGTLLVESQAAARASRLRRAREANAAHLRLARERLDIAEEHRADPGVLPGMEAAPVSLWLAWQRDLSAALARVAELEDRARELELAGDAEREHLGFELRLVDERVTASRRPLRPAETAAYAAVVFAMALSGAVVWVGAFDRRVRGYADVTACGLRLLGTVPSFGGDDASSYRAWLEHATGEA